ncbi:ileal sodium/bile acid cotransporter-like [Homarus americanus]|uniref:ileal sodium/bile acid cotransporter-like n=1 Tax=Homarus americanus TaxID=6706 RepID=UPI001C477D53|nr:ileal sodium/bile acid cotransporter-like [Homarus americanus]
MLWLWCMLVVVVVEGIVGDTADNGVYLEIFPSAEWKVSEDTLHHPTLSLGFNENDTYCDGGQDLTEAQLVVTVVPDEDWKLDFVNRSIHFTVEEVCDHVNKSLTFSGYYWGLTKLSFYLTTNYHLLHLSNNTLLRDDVLITVDRKSMMMDTIFTSTGAVLILFNNVNMGAQLDLKVIKEVLMRPIGPACGFISQFVVMPLASYVMGILLLTAPLQRLGLFTLGCSPGGTSSNFWTLMFDGDINLSITMTAISTIAAMGMMPMWMFSLGKKMLKDANITIPFGNLALSLITLTFPILLGILIRMKRPLWADRGAKIIKPFSFCILLFFYIVGTWNSYKVMLLMTWRMVVAGFLVVSSGYTFGAVFAKVMCLPKKQIIAVSIETALQNPGVAFILLKLSIESPYSDLASVPIVATLLVSAPPLILVYLIYALLRRFCGCCPDIEQRDDLTHTPEDVENLKQLPGDAKFNDEANQFLPESCGTD